MKTLIRWVALALAASTLTACVVVPGGGYYRHDRYYGPPGRYYHHDRGYGRPGWGAADVPAERVASAQTTPAH